MPEPLLAEAQRRGHLSGQLTTSLTDLLTERGNGVGTRLQTTNGYVVDVRAGATVLTRARCSASVSTAATTSVGEGLRAGRFASPTGTCRASAVAS